MNNREEEKYEQSSYQILVRYRQLKCKIIRSRWNSGHFLYNFNIVWEINVKLRLVMLFQTTFYHLPRDLDYNFLTVGISTGVSWKTLHKRSLETIHIIGSDCIYMLNPKQNRKVQNFCVASMGFRSCSAIFGCAGVKNDLCSDSETWSLNRRYQISRSNTEK